MKNIFVMITGGLLLALATLGMTVDSSFLPGSGQSAWEEFYSEDGRFAVLFPGIPEEETESFNTEWGTISRQTFFVEEDGGQTTFLVMCINYPREVIESADFDMILDGVRDDLMARYQGQVNNEDLVQLNNYTGREFNFEGKWKKRSVYGNVMTFLIEDRLYLLMAMGVEEAVDMDDVEKFFVSFESVN